MGSVATVWQLLAEELGLKLDVESVPGGCINHSAVLSGSEGQVFVKTNSADKNVMFAMEEYALTRLREINAVQVPEVFGRGIVGEFAYLALEYIPMRRGSSAEYRCLGEQLARLHLASSKRKEFGFSYENFIGATPQPNEWTSGWATFFAEQRICHQLNLAAEDGYRFEYGEKLVARIPELLAGHEPRPAFLHGDLWSGNAGFAMDGTPVVYDPASYNGDRETDIAFSEMFGGFKPEFYSGYRSTFPLDDGYEGRRELYNLYHVLNHYNLFGGSYREQAEGMIRRLLVGF